MYFVASLSQVYFEQIEELPGDRIHIVASSESV